MSDSIRPTADFLDQLTNEVLALRVLVQRRFRPLPLDLLNRKPSPSKWSVGQCLEHLNIMGGYYLPVIAARLRRALEKGSVPAATVKSGYFGRRKIETMRIPASVRPTITSQRYAPTGNRLPRTVTEVFSRQLDELLRLLLQARQVNANAVRIPNPIFPLLHLRLADQLELIVLHIQRHVAQAESVLDTMTIKE